MLMVNSLFINEIKKTAPFLTKRAVLHSLKNYENKHCFYLFIY